MRLVWKQAALPGTSRLKIWQRVGDSNSCALAVRQFSGLLGHQFARLFRFLEVQERIELSMIRSAGGRLAVLATGPMSKNW